MNVPVDVIATFNALGKIRPDFIRLQGDDHILYTHKIQNIEYTKENNYAGIKTLYFRCTINIEGIVTQLNIIYNINNHQWLLEN